MIRQILKQLLKNKKMDLLFEIFGTFLILFVICAIIFQFISNSNQPTGFEYKEITVLDIYPSGLDNNTVDIETFQKNIPGIKAYISGMNKIIQYSKAPNRNAPYLFETAWWPVTYNGVKYNSEDIHVSYSDDNYADVVNLKIIQGRWFNEKDNASNYRPAVINQKMAKEVFKINQAIGEIFEVDDVGECQVVGIMDNYNPGGELGKEKPIYILRNTVAEGLSYRNNENCSSNSLSIGEDYGGSFDGLTYFLKSKKEDQLLLESKLNNELTTKFNNINVKIRRLSEYRRQYMNYKLTPVIIVFIVLLFLIINTLAGLIGVLWYTIKTCQSEIALRMAVGSNRAAVFKQFIGEMLAMATLCIVPGIIIAAQFPILNVFDIETKIYIIAMLAAALVIYLLVTLCALLPSAQATKIQPAVALHEE